MRRLTLPIIGAGTESDPRRVDLPTYRMVRESPDGRTMVVEVPDEDFPDDPAWDSPTVQTGTPGEKDLTRLPLAAVGRWHDHIDARYAEHAGRFRPMPDRVR